MLNGRYGMHGGPSLAVPKGNRNDFKHGRYSAKAIARRREISALIRAARALSSAQPNHLIFCARASFWARFSPRSGAMLGKMRYRFFA
jgi:hypothetical protein